MAFVPAKMIEKVLKKHDVEVDGYDVIQSVEDDEMREADNLGMSSGIDRPYSFTSKYEADDCTITFYADVVEDYRNINDEEIPYYYLNISSCTINKDDKVYDEKVDVYVK